ncbi:lytic transglycosylase domain-containing protein [Fonticella tunisiensis]|uniref:Soluble lytic murein transglycosylase n=1 Tax=Fonticella tunisiensis TaxID=1096341 RepID=A0A4R7KPX1_9CLOT|nr:lytic transglycosylase domain-containing protein [Fonticella tunisiensis]TDT61189.1 soluble lytic murein transglycosylase [Fonticella tunisiensis]
MFKKAVIVVLIVVFVLVLNVKNIMKFFYPVIYSNIVEKYSTEYNIDSRLVYSLIKVESKFNPYAKSSKGAIGLMQITPQTGRYISKLIGEKEFNADTLYDPDTNVRYGCFYISKLYKDFDGNIDIILAAYNGGEGNVRKWLREESDGTRYLKIEDIPFSETKSYVYKVKKNYKIYKFLYSQRM